MPSISEPFYLGVIGKPILQSLSPVIHEAALEQLGLVGAYLRLAVDSVSEALTCSREMGLKGINVTAPFKSEVLTEIRGLDNEVMETSAANTIVFGQSVSAFNTDIYGIRQSLGLAAKRADGKTALIIGAGGAARAAVVALKQVGCKVFICNRTAEKATDLAVSLGVNQVDFRGVEALLKELDYLVNTVPATDQLIDLRNLQNRTRILDAIYAKETFFSKRCSSNPKYVNGRIWLLNQGLKAFELFTGVKLTDAQILAVENRLTTATRLFPNTISLIGMMGVGKSSVGESLGSVINSDVVDLDSLVEQKAGSSIAKLVTEQGEAVFRKIESECLASVLEARPRVLSCGAGVIGSESNRALLMSQTTPVWLWASKAELVERLANSTSRPLLQGHDLTTRINELMEQRFIHYAKVSELVVSTTMKTPVNIAKRIAFEFSNV